MKILIISQYFYPETFKVNTLAKEPDAREYSECDFTKKVLVAEAIKLLEGAA